MRARFETLSLVITKCGDTVKRSLITLSLLGSLEEGAQEGLL